MTKNVLNFILMFIVVVLIIVIYSSHEKSTELNKLTTTNIDTITNIVISRNKHDVNLNRNNDNTWTITQPVQIAANNFRIGSLLKIINAPVHSQYTVEEIDPSSTGLSNSTTFLKLNQTNIKFGIVNPVTNLRYIQIDNNIYTIEDVYYPLINSHFSTLVSFSLLPPETDIEKIILPDHTIQKDEDNHWSSIPESSAKAISDTLTIWKESQAFGVHEYIQRKNLGEISVYLKDSNKALQFVITDKEPWLIIARPKIGLEYHLEIESHSQLIRLTD